MPHRAESDEQRIESIYQAMLAALATRDIAALDSLIAGDIEFRSYSTGGEPTRGKHAVLAAVKATRDRIFDPAVLNYEHLGDGWIIASGRLRHSAEDGWMADGRKAALARVVDSKVHVSLASSTPEEARAEFAERQGEAP